MTHLSIANNQLTALPNEFTQLQALTYLCLSFNKLEAFPKQVLPLTKLETLAISANNMQGEVPDTITDLTQLRSYNTSLPHTKGLWINFNALAVNNPDTLAFIKQKAGTFDAKAEQVAPLQHQTVSHYQSDVSSIINTAKNRAQTDHGAKNGGSSKTDKHMIIQLAWATKPAPPAGNMTNSFYLTYQPTPEHPAQDCLKINAMSIAETVWHQLPGCSADTLSVLSLKRQGDEYLIRLLMLESEQASIKIDPAYQWQAPAPASFRPVRNRAGQSILINDLDADGIANQQDKNPLVAQQ